MCRPENNFLSFFTVVSGQTHYSSIHLFLRFTFFFPLLYLDIDTFISQTLKGENLSKKAKEKREVLLKKIKDVKAR